MCKMNILKALGIPPNADCTDDIPPDYEGSIGGPSVNQITGASELTVNESSVVLDPAIRAVGLPQVFQESEPNPQAGEIIINTSNCTDDIPPDYEGSIGGPSVNQITGASELTVNESSVVLDPAIRAVGLPQVFQESEPNPQAGEIIINTSSDLEPAVSSDSDTSLIMGVEVGLSDVEISTDQDYEVKS
ncbi:UNVERIFIED_CONTAM: hypothetical protein FKN15_035197 [Acipenser sinensis]